MRVFFLALALVAAPLAAATVASPVNLGATGLTLDDVELRLFKLDGTWATADASDITLTALGSAGEYVLGELPEATGAERYQLTIALADDPGEPLRIAEWGTFGERIVWRAAVQLPTVPRTFKTGTTEGGLELVVTNGLRSLAGASVTCTLAEKSRGTVVFADRAGTINDPVEDATTDSWGATFACAWQEGDLETAGKYVAEFTVEFADGKRLPLPTDNRLEITVITALGGS